MTRVMFSCTAGVGHFRPLVPLARAFADAGHDVVFATAASFAGNVEAAGFSMLAAGINGDESVARMVPYRQALVELPPLERRAVNFSRKFATIEAPAKVDGLRAAASAWKPDLSSTGGRPRRPARRRIARDPRREPFVRPARAGRELRGSSGGDRGPLARCGSRPTPARRRLRRHGRRHLPPEPPDGARAEGYARRVPAADISGRSAGCPASVDPGVSRAAHCLRHARDRLQRQRSSGSCSQGSAGSTAT